MAKVVELFKGLMQGDIEPGAGGYTISVRLNDRYNYGIFEVIGFKNVKGIAQSDTGVTFQSDGYKVFLLYEPINYPKRFMEPYLRDDADQIPLRFAELEVVEMPNKDRVFVSKQPYRSQGSFTVESPEEGNFVYYVSEGSQMDRAAEEFLRKVLTDDFKVVKRLLDAIIAPVHTCLEKFHDEVALSD